MTVVLALYYVNETQNKINKMKAYFLAKPGYGRNQKLTSLRLIFTEFSRAKLFNFLKWPAFISFMRQTAIEK